MTFAPERFPDSLPVVGNLLTTAGGTVCVVAPSWAEHAPASMTAYTPLAVSDSVVAGYLPDGNDEATVAVYRLMAWSGPR
ncbi:MAG: hypothetical protein SFU84_11325 [Gemmatimonadales bacterium]|nr:hypothetical protein [Gemmatimonadales bacterium]